MTGPENIPELPGGSTGGAEGTDGSARQPDPEQQAAWRAAPPEDRDPIQRALRLRHVRDALAGAVMEGRVSRVDADAVLERLARGEDAHQLRRELRLAGVLPGRVERTDR